MEKCQDKGTWGFLGVGGDLVLGEWEKVFRGGGGY